MRKLISDEYRVNRGSWSRVLQIFCKNCNQFLFFYQKDGPGVLKRCYLDRMLGGNPKNEDYRCNQCKQLLGIYQPYEKENNRPAIRWLVDSLTYKVISHTNYLHFNSSKI